MASIPFCAVYRGLNSLTVQFCDHLLDEYQNHDKEREPVNRIETLQGRLRHSLSVYRRLEPKSTNPDPLSDEQLLFTHLAKVNQTHFTEDRAVPHFDQSVSYYSSFVIGKYTLASFQRVFQRWPFL